MFPNITYFYPFCLGISDDDTTQSPQFNQMEKRIFYIQKAVEKVNLYILSYSKKILESQWKEEG